MKKVLSFTLVVCMLITLSACGNNASGQRKAASLPVDSLVAQQNDSGEDSQTLKETDAGVGSQTPKETDAGVGSQPPEETDTGQEEQEIDVDLTELSSTMVYSEVLNMMTTPEDYVGKTVKMNGSFNLYCQKVDENGQPDFDYPIYYSCIIADATACCSQGLEFVLAGDFTYPDDYPELGGDITVIGTFETYEEDGVMYCHLVNAKMTA